MDIIDLYFSDQEFGPEQEREIAAAYHQYIGFLDQCAERFAFERELEM